VAARSAIVQWRYLAPGPQFDNDAEGVAFGNKAFFNRGEVFKHGLAENLGSVFWERDLRHDKHTSQSSPCFAQWSRWPCRG
jgi:hypothetical protein